MTDWLFWLITHEPLGVTSWNSFSTSTELWQKFASCNLWSLQKSVTLYFSKYAKSINIYIFTSLHPNATKIDTDTLYTRYHVSNGVQICRTMSLQWHSVSYCNSYCMFNIFYFAIYLIKLQSIWQHYCKHLKFKGIVCIFWSGFVQDTCPKSAM